MTYEEAIRFWFDRVNFEQKSPLVGDLKLGRMRQLLSLLDDPHRRLRIIHIAGSKGKGSTSAMLASILQHDGYRTGLFTSPHLVDVEERIQVDRVPISRAELAALMQEIRTLTPPKLMQELTFFEIGTALGFLHFVRRRTDFAIVEVGLGGRFDSTNVCRPLVSVITSISFDHTQILGKTLGQIAFEKAGIIKPEIPVVSGVRNPEARAVITEIAGKRHAPLRQLDEHFRYEHEPARITDADERLPRVRVAGRQQWPALPLGLIGEHQARNAAVALAVVEELQAQGVTISAAAVARGLEQVSWPARLEIVQRRPLVLLDCAHNVASAQALVQALRSSFAPSAPPSARRILIFGGNQDKDLAGMLSLLAPEFERVYLTSFHNLRCADPEQLLELMPAEKRAACILCPDAATAWRLARDEAGPDDRICITGSVFLAGELRPILLGEDGEHMKGAAR
jgi:dihydrofolate synthase/folylpolyglutamate synthase